MIQNQKKLSFNDVELRICARYKLLNRIGGSQFGQIYKGQNVQNNLQCAIKMELIKSRHPQVLYEGKIMQNLQGGPGIPQMYWCGQEGDYNFLVMEHLECNLQDMLEKCGGKFSLRCVLLLSKKLMKNIQYIHFKHYVHRDLKPENFMIGVGKKSNNFYTIDFGLSKKYIEQASHQHIPFRDRKPLIGTSRFASINAHKGCEISRRDDLESFAYVLIYLLTGTLPWIGIKAKNKEDKHTKVKQMKINMPEEDICDGCPKQFITFLKYAKSLSFQEKPNYTYISNLFDELMDQYNYLDDNVFDWYLIQEQIQQVPSSIKDINYEDYLPYKEDVCDDEQEFIRSLNLGTLQNDPDLSPELLGDLVPLPEIKLPDDLRTIMPVQKNEFSDSNQNWKQQQQECVRIIKEQQFLSNEKEMKGNNSVQFSLKNINISNFNKNGQIPQEEVTYTVREGYNQSNHKQFQQQNQPKFGTFNNFQQQQGNNNSNGTFQTNNNLNNQNYSNSNKTNFNSEFQKSQNNSIRPGHQKKKSGCQVF